MPSERFSDVRFEIGHVCDSYEARLVESFDAFRRREREGTKSAKESLNPERWLCGHASFKALAHFVRIRMPLNRMNLSIQSRQAAGKLQIS